MPMVCPSWEPVPKAVASIVSDFTLSADQPIVPVRSSTPLASRLLARTLQVLRCISFLSFPDIWTTDASPSQDDVILVTRERCRLAGHDDSTWQAFLFIWTPDRISRSL
jgi:hypothetical protein